MSDPVPTPTPPAPMADYSIPGMRIQPGLPGDPWTLLVRTAARRDDWVLEPQGAAERVSTMITPTTIRYRGRLYRVYDEVRTETGWLYRMQDCPDGETILQVVELDRAVVAQVAAEKKDFAKVQAMTQASARYELLLGWLPAAWQVKLSERLHFSPADATRKNGLAMVMLGIGLGALYLAQFQFGVAFVLVLAAIDGAIRWIAGLLNEQPLGFLPLEGIACLGRVLIRGFYRLRPRLRLR